MARNHKSKEPNTLNAQLSAAVEAGNAPAPAAPASEADDLMALFEEEALNLPEMPVVDETVLNRLDNFKRATVAFIVKATERLWGIRRHGDVIATAQPGYAKLFNDFFVVDDEHPGYLKTGVFPVKGGMTRNEGLAVLPFVQKAYAETALSLIPPTREMFHSLVDDMIAVGAFAKAEKMDIEAKRAIFFGDDIVILYEGYADDKEWLGVVKKLVAKWNEIRSSERSEFKADKSDLFEKWKSLPHDKKLSLEQFKEGKTPGFRYLFAPAATWIGTDGKPKDRRATAMVVEVTENLKVRITEATSTDPDYEAMVDALIKNKDIWYLLPANQIGEKRVTLKNKLSSGLFDQLRMVHQLIGAGVRNAESREKRKVEVKSLRNGTIDLVSWFKDTPAGSTSVEFKRWQEGEETHHLTVRFGRSKEGRGSSIVFEDFAPKVVGKKIPALEMLVGKEFIPTGGPKFEGNVSGGVDTAAAKFFRRLLSAGYGIACAVEKYRDNRDKKTDVPEEPANSTAVAEEASKAAASA